jgi:ABC-type uncharacterized transport system permease subunit
MAEDDKFTKAAKTDFTLRLIAGFIFGILAAIISLVFVVISAINNNLEFVVALIVMIVVGLGVSVSCGYFLFRKGNKEEKKE